VSLEAGGGIPCRTNPAAKLLVRNVSLFFSASAGGVPAELRCGALRTVALRYGANHALSVSLQDTRQTTKLSDNSERVLVAGPRCLGGNATPVQLSITVCVAGALVTTSSYFRHVTELWDRMAPSACQ